MRNLTPAAPLASEGRQRDEGAGRNRSGVFLGDFEERGRAFSRRFILSLLPEGRSAWLARKVF